MATKPQESLAQALSAPGLQWLGIQVGWPRRITDFAANSELAASLAGPTATWQVRERELTIQIGGTSVVLGDGYARFAVSTGKGFQRFRESFPLVGRNRSAMRLSTTAQFLFPLEAPFDTTVSSLASVALNESFASSIGATMQDFAYLADFMFEGQWMQLSYGVVRSTEIPQRLNALPPLPLPDVALFLQVTSNWKPPSESSADAEERIGRLLRLAEAAANRLRR